VLSYDMVGYNDQFQLPHWGAEPLEWRRWGFSRAGLQTWNSLCAFEWLRQQREIDPQCIGCSGISGGGTQTFLLSALEPRLSCAAPVKMVSSVMQGGCICENAPLLRLLAGNPEIAGLTAPRPMLLISDAGDWTRDNPDVVAPYLKRVYGLFHAEGQFVHAHFSEGHQWGAEPRRAYYEWIARVWRLPRTPQDPDLRWESLLPALRVWGDALPKPSDAPTGDAVLRLYQRLSGESVARWRRTRRFEAEARAALLSMLGLERVEDARDDPMPDAWQGVLPSRRYARLMVVLSGASVRRWERAGYAVVRLPELPRPASKTDYAYLATYNLTPDTARARTLLGVLMRLKPRATRLAVAAHGEWATLCAIACALAQVPLDAPSLAEPDLLDLPCYDRLGGAATLRQILASPE